MSLMVELSRRTKRGLYHGIINPDPEASRQMTAADWHRAADILETELKLSGQKRVMILHEKKGRLHMHCAWDRWDFDKNRVIPHKNNYYAQDRARKQMELEFGHKRTPDINIEKRELRKLATQLWQRHPDGKDFVRALEEQGYTVCRSNGRRPLVVVNRHGLSFDLVRPIKGANTEDVQNRLKGIHLPIDKKIMERIGQERKQRYKPDKKQMVIDALQENLRQKEQNGRQKGRGR